MSIADGAPSTSQAYAYATSSPSGSTDGTVTALIRSSVVTGFVGLMVTDGEVGTPFTIRN